MAETRHIAVVVRQFFLELKVMLTPVLLFWIPRWPTRDFRNGTT
jgi:hypothetical protein